MKNKTETRKCGRNYSFSRAKLFVLAGLGMMIALGTSSLVLYTRTAAMQELEKPIPPLNGDAAVEFLKKDRSFGSLEKAMADAVREDISDNPEAVVKLTAPDARTNDFFGTSVAISGDTLIVGASQAREGNGGTLRGAAYIFIRNGAGWSFQQKLTGDGSGGPDGFGVGVAISGDTVVVAAPDEDLGDEYDGVAYVFVRNGTTWSLQKKLTPSDTPLVEGEGFYQGSVAVSGDTILVGATGLLEFSDHETMVHVFVREGTTWTPQALLTSIDEGQDVRFGHSVAISGDIAVVGDPYLQNGSPHMESTYIFVRCGTTWTRQQRLTPNEGPGDRHFGGSVAISGSTVIIGAEGDRPTPINQQGAAYIFVSDGTTWTQQQKLTANDSGTDSRFGLSVAIMGDTAIVGKPRHATEPFNRGFAFVYQRTGTAWALQETLTASDGVTGDGFGASVAISENAVLVGADDDDFGTAQTREGSAYAIDRTTAPPPPFNPCETEIEVTITTDQPDADIEDDVCDVDENTSGEQCSMRAAIETANAKAGPDEISFNIEGAGPHTISPATAFPAITEKVLLDATTQPGYTASPLIELSGNGGFAGLTFAGGSGNSSVSGLAVNRFLTGISLQTSGIKVERSYFGLAPNGSPAGMVSVQQVGVEIKTAAASNNTIGGVGNLMNVISNNLTGVAITLGATGNEILGNRIGTNVAGTAAIPNQTGIVINAANNNKIGNGTPERVNLISGNAANGIEIIQTTGNSVKGNKIGVTLSLTALGNGGHGIVVRDSPGTFIGGELPNEGNIVCNNSGNGILVETTAANPANRILGGPPTTIQGNHVGVTLDTFAMGGGIKLGPNGLSGIVTKALGVKIGGTGAGAGNSVGANVGPGIQIEGPAAESNEVLGNFIGAIRNAQGAILAGGNGSDGIKVSGSSVGTKIGGIVGGAGNTILNNTGNGILVEAGDEGVTRRFRAGGIPPTVIEGNKVGVELDTFAMGGIKLGPNGLTGILTKAIGVKIGGTGAGAGNSIGANVGAGIKVEGPAAESNEILGNFIGAIRNAQGAISSGLGNGGDGISVGGGAGNKIGGNVAAAANIIVNNAGNGVTISGAAAADNEVHGNLIGTTTATIPDDFPLGAATTGNGQDGIVVRDAPRPQIGRADTSYSNVVAHNAGNGVRVDSASGTYGSPVYVYGNDLVGNAINGILTTVQHNDPHIIEGNKVRSNAQAGIKMVNSNRNEVIQNRVENNVGIGVMLDGIQTTLINVRSNIINENGSHGVDIDNGANTNNIGGSAPNQGNTITNNGGNGIRLGPAAGSGNNLDPNIIFGNTLGGIDLGGDGFTPNDPTDADAGPNNLQNYPTLTVTITGGDLIVSYQVDSAPANSVYGTTGIRAEFFEANAVGEGSNFLGFDVYTTQNYANGTPGTKQINLGNAAALGFVPGDRMTATATDTAGNSSEFTPAVTAPGGLGFEGDISPRPNGDGNMLSTDITQMRRFVSGLDTPNLATNEAQRIDCAPRSSFGDGVINSSDVVQGRRYVSGLDVLTPAGGPASRGGSVPESIFVPNRDSGGDLFQRELSIGEPEFRRSTVIVPIEMTSHGNEVAMSFTLEYDHTVLANPRITLGRFAPAGSTLTVNTNEPGRIGILIDSANAMIASATPQSIVTVSFDVKREASGEAPIYLTGSLAAAAISDALGNSLSTKYVGGVVRFEAKIY